METQVTQNTNNASQSKARNISQNLTNEPNEANANRILGQNQFNNNNDNPKGESRDYRNYQNTYWQPSPNLGNNSYNPQAQYYASPQPQQSYQPPLPFGNWGQNPNQNQLANSTANQTSQFNPNLNQTNQNQIPQPTEQFNSFNTSSLSNLTDEQIKKMNSSQWKGFIDSTVQKERNYEKQLTEANEKIQTLERQLFEFNEVALLGSLGFDARQYRDIKNLCSGMITPERLQSIKNRKEYNFLLEQVKGNNPLTPQETKSVQERLFEKYLRPKNYGNQNWNK